MKVDFMLVVMQDLRAQLLSMVDESLYIKNMIQALFLISYFFIIDNMINSSGQMISESFLNVNLFIGLFCLGIYSFFTEVLYTSKKDFLVIIVIQVYTILINLNLYFFYPVLPL